MERTKAVLPIRGTGCDDDEVGGLPSQRELVEAGEAGRDAVHRAALCVRLLDGLHRLVENETGALDIALDVSLRNLENLRFGVVYQVGHVGTLIVGAALYLGRGADEFPLHVFLCDDGGVELDVHRRGHLLRQLGEKKGRRPPLSVFSAA